jgi:hypothetical protein
VGLTAGSNDTSSASSVSFTPTSTGYWCFAAYYSGDSNYASSDDSTTTGGCFDVTGLPSSTTSTPTDSTIVLGNSNTDNAVVTGGATFGSPTGSVTFYQCYAGASPAPCTSKLNKVGAGAVGLTAGSNDTSSALSAPFIATSTGYWCFAAYYSGDSSYASSDDSTTTDGCFDVTTAHSTSTTSTPTASTIVLGSSNTDIAVVTGDATFGSPTGSVTFYYCYAGASPAPCTSKLNKVGTGAVTLTTGTNDTSSATSAVLHPADTGYYCFGAYYLGNSNYQASSDTTLEECFDVVPPAPTITRFTPASGAPGSTVRIYGTNLSGATSVTFNGVAAKIKSDTSSEIKVKVPAGALKGYIKVTTAGGTVESATKFRVT